MLFLIEYDRREGQLVNITQYSDDQRATADNVRLDLELRLLRAKVDHEVVVLEAASLDALRKTHRRYFLGIEALASAPNADDEK